MFLCVVILLTMLVDQSSKALIKYFLAEGESVPVIPHVFHLTYIRNPGAAFGLFAYQTTFFIVASIIVLVLVLVALKHIPENRWLFRLSLGLLLGGNGGNLLDRLRTGLVVDFLDLRVWPVFNLADCAIVLGAFLLVWELWRGGWDSAREEKGNP